ncbi:MAG: STELLO glycosyltransferase family protein [Rhodovibrio sp.]|nr:STELLO glycosyltransferase family protein [Rhodovibrio sp.]
MNSKNALVVTTIHEPGDFLDQILAVCADDFDVIVVGDTITPSSWEDAPVHFLSIDRQRQLFGEFASVAPLRHYSRKNFGYLYAQKLGAPIVLETDDDTFPYPKFGRDLVADVEGRLANGGDWENVYSWFTDQHVWPRGLPLSHVTQRKRVSSTITRRRCLVQQFLIDGDTDVDAIYRLTSPQGDVLFNADELPVILANDTVCPFNSQNTAFHAAAFPLLYLPHHCSFRMTDIWRSFVVQVALATAGEAIAFRGPTSHQVRNAHDLMRDFEQEVSGYLHNASIMTHLKQVARTLSDVSSCADGPHVVAQPS